MKKYLKKLIRRQRKKRPQKTSGFTLIELLVALAVASIMISALLGFMVNILTTDRKEQAKSRTEQEIQTAIDYIRRDLSQAVFIYDAEGVKALTGNYSATACTSDPVVPYKPPGSCSQIPPVADGGKVVRIPVLVFWKRYFLPAEREVTVEKGKMEVGCLVKLSDKPDEPESKFKGECDKQDYRLYSLVAYYLIKDDSETWSNAARIGRFEIRDGIKDADGDAKDGNREEKDPIYGGKATVNYDLQPSQGFMPFNLGIPVDDDTDVLSQIMNKWQKHADSYNVNVTVLVDYIDQTREGAPLLKDCPSGLERTLDYSVSISTELDSFKTGSFYACVQSSNPPVAQVHIRGNALARIQNEAKYSSEQSAFFPRTEIMVEGIGAIYAE